MKSVHCLSLLVISILFSGGALADDENSKDKQDEQQAKYKKFEEMLSGVKLVGKFTIVGKEDKALQEEEYTISKVTKTPKGDYWLIAARIKYGSNDYTVPLPLEVKWADDTPMITLTDFKILGQGPFSARVIFYNNKYAGTWSHGKVGGHLFGKIVKIEQDDAAEKTKAESE